MKRKMPRRKNTRELRTKRDDVQLADGFISIPAAAEMLEISASRVYAIADAGLLARRKVGGSVYVALKAVKAYRESLQPPAGWIPIRQAAEEHGYARTSLLYRVRRGELEAREIGGRTYIHGPTLRKLLEPAA